MLRRLQHDGIVRYYDSFETEDETPECSGTLHIIMEYCSEGSLAEAIEEHKNSGKLIPAERIRRWAMIAKYISPPNW